VQHPGLKRCEGQGRQGGDQLCEVGTKVPQRRAITARSDGLAPNGMIAKGTGQPQHCWGWSSCALCSSPHQTAWTQSGARVSTWISQHRRRKQMTECPICAPGTCNGYFGLCPVCHETDGYLNIGRSHWFYCIEHKKRWCVGSNLFSGWRDEIEEEQRKLYDEVGMSGFENVEAYCPPECIAFRRDTSGPVKCG
jgi:hypothetical protein